MSGRLGATNLYANTTQAIYVCNRDVATVVTLNICNRGTSAVTVRAAVSTSATNPLNTEWVEYDSTIVAKGVLERTGLWVSPGQYLVVRSSADSVNAVCWGVTQGDVDQGIAGIPTAPPPPGTISGSIVSIYSTNFADNPLRSSVAAGSITTWSDGTEYNTAGSTQWAQSLASNGSLLMTFAASTGEVAVSNDGLTWTAATSLPARIVNPTIERWSNIVWGPNNRWVASARNYISTQIAYSTDNGLSWTNSSLGAAGNWQVISGNGIYLAVAQDGTRQLQTSTDAVTWTAAATPTVNRNTGHDSVPIYIPGVGWADINFSYLGTPGEFGLKIQISTDNCATWGAITNTASIPGMTSTPIIAYGNGRLVAVVAQNASSWTSTNNGATWTQHASAFSAYGANLQFFARHYYEKGYFIALTSQFASFTNAVYYSTDGITWTRATRGANPVVNALASLN